MRNGENLRKTNIWPAFPDERRFYLEGVPFYLLNFLKALGERAVKLSKFIIMWAGVSYLGVGRTSRDYLISILKQEQKNKQ